MTGDSQEQAQAVVAERISEPGSLLAWVCPSCRSPLEARSDDQLYCPVDDLTFSRVDGIWRFLLPERAAYFEQFIQDYEAIRRAEGRGLPEPSFYRALPYQDISGRFSEDWRIRARSFESLLEHVVAPLERGHERRLTILDLGAGNGWLSNRLAERGHTVVAVDLLVNDLDGLGAHVYYSKRFTPVQSEFDRLPLADEQADLVIFNGSLHYSTDYQATLREARRVLRLEGLLAIVDTPVYRDAESGRQMVREREAAFEQRYGTRSNAVPSENFLTYRRLRELAAATGLDWQIYTPFYGWHWLARPLKARLRGGREPAKFHVIAGRGFVSRTSFAVGPLPARTVPRRARTSLNTNLNRLRRGLWRRALAARVRYLERQRDRQVVLEEVAGRQLVVLPDVFNPKRFRSSEMLARTLDAQPLSEQDTVLDLGTGSGIGAITAAARSARVTAVDINPEAVRCARINAQINRVDQRITVRQSDLFNALPGERFDLVLFNPPFYRGQPRDLLDHAWRSTDVIERFAAELGEHLTPTGQALVVLSTDGETEAFMQRFREYGFNIEIVDEQDLIIEIMTVYRLTKVGEGPVPSRDANVE